MKNTWKISYGQKRGRKSHWQFDSQPLKVGDRPDFLTCRWHATYRWKALNKGYNFVSNFISIGGLHAKLWASKVTGVLIVGILGLPFGSPKTKWYLGAGFVAKHKIYYKGNGDGFLQIQAVMNFVNLCLLVVRPCNKVLALCTNQLIV